MAANCVNYGNPSNAIDRLRMRYGSIQKPLPNRYAVSQAKDCITCRSKACVVMHCKSQGTYYAKQREKDI